MPGSARAMIAVDKMGGKFLFLNPTTYETEAVLDDFPRTVHELLVVPETGLAYVPIFGDGIHGRNPNPRHLLLILALMKSARVALYLRSSRKVVDCIDSGSTNGHRLIIAPDGERLYTENEEDATVSVIDLPKRKLLGKINTPRPLAGITISPDGRTVIAVDDAEPTLFLIDTQA